MLAVRNLKLIAERRSIYPVWDVDLDVERGERIVVVGESGGGKTSLAWALLGRPLPGQRFLGGSVLLDGRDLLSLSAEERAKLYYRRLALVPQNVQDSFHPTQTLWESARELLQKEATVRLRREDVLPIADSFGRPLDVARELWNSWPHQLSGGQKQRMGLILALLNNPELLILDEPTNALDELTRVSLVAFLDEWSSIHHSSIVLFTHDIGLARSWGDRIVVLYRGEIVEELPAGMVDEAIHPYTRGLLDSAIRLGDRPRSRRSIPGCAMPVQRAPQGCGYCDRCPWTVSDCTEERPALVRVGRGKVRCRQPMALETTAAVRGL